MKKKIARIEYREQGEYNGTPFHKFAVAWEDGSGGFLTAWKSKPDLQAGQEIQVEDKGEFNDQKQWKLVTGSASGGKSGYKPKPAELEAAIISSGVLKSMLESKAIVANEWEKYATKLFMFYLPLMKEGGRPDQTPLTAAADVMSAEHTGDWRPKPPNDEFPF